MKILFRVLIFIFLLPAQVFAQSENLKDYIVTSAGDTVYGKVEYHILKNKKVCRFTSDGRTSVFTPAQIRGFCTGGEKFFTSQVLEDTFLQVLIAGELSLYKDAINLYLEKKGQKLLKLQSSEKADTIDGKIYISKDLSWKGFVNIMVHDCITDPKTINNLSLDERSLTELAINYNNCKGAKYVDYLAKKPWSRAECGIRSGLTMSRIGVDNKTVHSYFLPDKFLSYDPSFGIFLALSSPRFMNRIALQTEVEFVSSKFFSEVIKNYTNVTGYYDTYISFTTLSFPQSLRYTVTDRNYRLFVNLGLTFAKNIHEETRIDNEILTGDQVFTGSLQPYLIRRRQAGLWSGITCLKTFRRFDAGISVRYSRLNKIIYDIFDSNTTRLSLSLIVSTK